MAQDKQLVCSDCGQEFTFTAGEQEFFVERGFSEPIRCKSCRDIRKAQKAERGGGSGGSGFGGGSGGFGGGGFGGDRRGRR